MALGWVGVSDGRVRGGGVKEGCVKKTVVWVGVGGGWRWGRLALREVGVGGGWSWGRLALGVGGRVGMNCMVNY